MLVIGLTGGIGSGKSTVCDLFAKFDVPIIDADNIAHELTEPGQPALEEIRKTFGDDIFTNRVLDRAKLRQSVFSDQKKRLELESILHPLVLVEIHNRVEKIQAPYCIVCIPLLLETDMTENIDRILVVDSPEQDQIRRVQERSQLSEHEVRNIMSAQFGREQRLAAANDIILNDADIAHLEKQVTELHARYLELSRP